MKTIHKISLATISILVVCLVGFVTIPFPKFEQMSVLRSVLTPDDKKGIFLERLWTYNHYKYVYKGNETERECRRNLKKIRAHAGEIDILNYGSILLKNSGIGELAWTIALVHRDMQVYAVEADTDKHLIAAHTSYIPGNLHFVREGETVPQCDYSIDCQVFLK